uniref:Jessie 1b n=1 Tax=Entamoeba invadens TaxID=33085 RepID=Q2LEB2_ENTIV|nr:Jessie 1b [Entamoeba invadens]
MNSFLLLLVVSAFSQTYECYNLTYGFYCYDKSIFMHCRGENAKAVWLKCRGGTVCKCGRTTYNPCVFDYNDVDDCEGKPGSYLNEKSLTPPEIIEEESSNTNKPTTQSTEKKPSAAFSYLLYLSVLLFALI